MSLLYRRLFDIERVAVRNLVGRDDWSLSRISGIRDALASLHYAAVSKVLKYRT